MRRSLNAAIEASAVDGPRLVPGARHRLELELRGSGKTRLIARFDDAVLVDERVNVAASDGPIRYEFATFQSLSVLDVVIRTR